MGVPTFIRSLTQTFGIRKLTKDKLADVRVHYLYFDLPSLIHQAAQKTFHYGVHANPAAQASLANLDDDELLGLYHKTLFEMLETAIETAAPSKGVYIAMDGVPVYAKVVQQRMRRFVATSSLLFDPVSITVGTVFMDRLADRIRAWIDTRPELSYIFSDHRETGEAEHKIADYIRTNFGERDRHVTHVIHGLDTDILFISLVTRHEILLWNDNESDFPQVLDVGAIRRTLVKMLGDDAPLTFVVATAVLGNDFIPRHKSLEDFGASMRVIVDILMEQRESLATRDAHGHAVVRWKPYLRFLLALAAREPELAIAAHKKTRSSIATRATESFRFNYGVYATSYREMVSSRHPDAQLADIGANYIEMVAFVLSYYHDGMGAIDKDMYYRYYYAPLLSDLVRGAVESVARVAREQHWRDDDAHSEYLTPVQLMAATLPPRAFYLMSDIARLYMENVAMVKWPSWYPNEVARDTDGYAVDHVGPVFVPIPSPGDVRAMALPSY